MTSQRFLNQDEEPVPPQRLDWFVVLVLVADTAVRATTFLSEVAEQVDDTVRAHGNWRRQNDDIIEEIERL